MLDRIRQYLFLHQFCRTEYIGMSGIEGRIKMMEVSVCVTLVVTVVSVVAICAGSSF